MSAVYEFPAPYFSLATTNMETLHSPETPQHLLSISEDVVRYAAGQISYQAYSQKLNDWWEKNKEAWQEHDLDRLFLLVCLEN